MHGPRVEVGLTVAPTILCPYVWFQGWLSRGQLTVPPFVDKDAAVAKEDPRTEQVAMLVTVTGNLPIQ